MSNSFSDILYSYFAKFESAYRESIKTYSQNILSKFVAEYAINPKRARVNFLVLYDQFFNSSEFGYINLLDKSIANMTVDLSILSYRRSAEGLSSSMLGIIQERVKLDRGQVSEIRHSPTQYDNHYFWVDPSGKRLSDRIWVMRVENVKRINQIMQESISSGESAISISNKIKDYVSPTSISYTKKPYGSLQEFNCMRLARSEITRAHSTTSKYLAINNPMVNSMDWALSASHPRTDICDSIATISMAGGRIRKPYPKEESPIPVIDSHPQCLCSIYPNVESDIAKKSSILSDMLEQPSIFPNQLTPISLILMQLLVQKSDTLPRFDRDAYMEENDDEDMSSFEGIEEIEDFLKENTQFPSMNNYKNMLSDLMLSGFSLLNNNERNSSALRDILSLL